MTNNKQSGFGVAIVIIVAVVVLAILGYAGYRLYTSQANKPATTSNTTTNQTTNNTQSSNTQTNNAQTDPNAGYIVITDWGVRFKPVSGLNGVTTSIVSSTRPNATEAMLMTTAMQALTIPACNGQASGSRPLGAIVRTQTAEDLSQHLNSDQLLKQIGSYFYYYYKPADLCDPNPNSNTIDALQNDTLNQIESSLSSLEASK